MDNAVALVQAYLHLNGYFTVTEYPVLEAMEGSSHRMATDVDVLAFRLPKAGGLVTAGDRRRSESSSRSPVDADLDVPEDRADLIIAEVKEGRAELNRGATNPDVLAAVLLRFGRIAVEDLESSVESLRRSGEARLSERAQVRLMAFGKSGESVSNYKVVTLGHVLESLERHLQDHWDVLKHAQIRDPAVGFLATLAKVR